MEAARAQAEVVAQQIAQQDPVTAPASVLSAYSLPEAPLPVTEAPSR